MARRAALSVDGEVLSAREPRPQLGESADPPESYAAPLVLGVPEHHHVQVIGPRVVAVLPIQSTYRSVLL